MKTLRQIFAIARTEFRFSFRRGGPVVPTVLLGLVLDVGILLVTIQDVNSYKADMQYNFYSDPARMQQFQQEGIAFPTILDFAASINTDGLIMPWSYFYILTFLLLVSAVAPAIPADRQFGVMEILRCLPISGGRYLAGKVLGVIAATVMVAALPLLAYCAIPWLLVGAIPIQLLTRLVLLDGLPVLLCAVSLGVLLGTPLARRFLAVGFGFFTGIFGLAAIMMTSKKNPYLGGGFLTPPAAYVLHLTDTTGMPLPQVSTSEVVIFYAATTIVLILLAILARTWLQWKENF